VCVPAGHQAAAAEGELPEAEAEFGRRRGLPAAVLHLGRDHHAGAGGEERTGQRHARDPEIPAGHARRAPCRTGQRPGRASGRCRARTRGQASRGRRSLLDDAERAPARRRAAEAGRMPRRDGAVGPRRAFDPQRCRGCLGWGDARERWVRRVPGERSRAEGVSVAACPRPIGRRAVREYGSAACARRRRRAEGVCGTDAQRAGTRMGEGGVHGRARIPPLRADTRGVWRCHIWSNPVAGAHRAAVPDRPRSARPLHVAPTRGAAAERPRAAAVGPRERTRFRRPSNRAMLERYTGRARAPAHARKRRRALGRPSATCGSASAASAGRRVELCDSPAVYGVSVPHFLSRRMRT
jgi:hypothetical protein